MGHSNNVGVLHQLVVGEIGDIGGNPAGVRSALQSVGAKKVPEVKDKDLQTLFDAMELNN